MLSAARRNVALFVSGLLFAALLVAVPAVTTTDSASAAVTGSDFSAGNIISDAVFYNSSTMNATQVQAFLNSQVSKCASGSSCLKDYKTTANSQIARSNRCDAYAGGNNISAASIIAGVAKACGINPQVLITLLQKEQGLVTDSSPVARQYRSATGYGCPDTADCDTKYYGFANQVYNAALQFKTYRASPSGRGYVAGRDNVIRWSPTASCGSSTVYIENQATAGLYLYTPYRPNAAALANLRGTGDACSAYGNRNFWRQFNDWFGSTQLGNNFLRTTASETVYLVVGTTKHAITDYNLFTALSKLGSVGFVSQGYLDQLATGETMSRVVGDASGNLYLVDSGGKRKFTTCEQVAAFGFNCSNYIKLTASQNAQLSTAGTLTDVVKSDNALFWINNSTRAQALDSNAMKAAGHSAAATTLRADAIAHLKYTTPIMREGVLVRRGSTSTYGLYYSSKVATVSSSMYSTSSLSKKLTAVNLKAESFDQLPSSGTLSGLVKDSSGRSYLLTPSGRIQTASGVALGLSATTLPASILSKLPVNSGTVYDPAALKSPTSAVTWAVGGSSKRELINYADYEKYAKTLKNKSIITVAAPIIGSLTTSSAYLPTGSMIKTASSSTIYFVDGGKKLPVTSVGALQALGLSSSTRTVSDSVMSSFATGSALGTAVQGPNGKYLALQGTLYPVNADSIKRWAMKDFASVSANAIASLKVSKSQPTRYLASGSDLYVVYGGTKRHIVSMDVYTKLGGTATNRISANSYTLGTLKLGTPAVSSDLSIQPVFVKSSTADTVYQIKDGKRQTMASWAQYVAAAANSSNKTIYTVPQSAINKMAGYAGTATAIKASNSNSVYFIDGSSKRLYVDSMDVLNAIGRPNVTTVPADTVSSLAQSNGNLRVTLACGSANDKRIGINGKLWKVTGDNVARYNTTYLSVAAETCAALPQSSTSLPKFLTSPAGDIFMMDKNGKRHITSMAKFSAQGGKASTLLTVPLSTLDLFKTGADL